MDVVCRSWERSWIAVQWIRHVMRPGRDRFSFFYARISSLLRQASLSLTSLDQDYFVHHTTKYACLGRIFHHKVAPCEPVPALPIIVTTAYHNPYQALLSRNIICETTPAQNRSNITRLRTMPTKQPHTSIPRPLALRKPIICYGLVFVVTWLQVLWNGTHIYHCMISCV
jgi:hypothetical protein